MGDIEDGPSAMNSQSSMSNASSFCYGFTSWYRVPSSNPKAYRQFFQFIGIFVFGTLESALKITGYRKEFIF